MTRWRQRIGPEAMERILKATVAAALATKTVKLSSLERVTVDTTVQPKTTAHPTVSRLYLKALEILVCQAKRAGITLRHDYEGEAQVILAGRRRGLTPTMKRGLKRRSAIEPMIGYAREVYFQLALCVRHFSASAVGSVQSKLRRTL
jgi:hypothetical protein